MKARAAGSFPLVGFGGKSPGLLPVPCGDAPSDNGGGGARDRPPDGARSRFRMSSPALQLDQRSLAERPRDALGRVRPVSCAGDVEQHDGQAVGQQVRRLLEAALGTLPVRTAGWERPRSDGEDGAVRLRPPRCRLRHAEMGGRSQPRPTNADRHRRSAGRVATAGAPAVCNIQAIVRAERRFLVRTPPK